MTTIHIDNVHIHPSHDRGQLDRIERKVNRILQAQGEIMADLSALTASADEQTTVDASIIALLDSIAAQLEAAQTDPAAIAAVVDTIRNNNSAIVAAVLAHTPAAPPVEEPPAPPEG